MLKKEKVAAEGKKSTLKGRTAERRRSERGLRWP